MNQIMQHDFEDGGPVAGPYYAKDLGAPFKVYLANGFELIVNPITKKPGIAIPDLPGLIAAVVRARVLHSRKLSGDDLKYIRSALCLKSKEVAKAIELTAEHYSRCESGPKTMSVATEKAYRAYIYLASLWKNKELQSILQKEKMEISPQKAKTAFSAFQKLFLEMKINAVFDPEEELEFVFTHRGRGNSQEPRGDDGPEWSNEPELIAA